MLDTPLDEWARVSGAKWTDARRHAGYSVYDPVGQKIGRAEEVFVNRDGEPVYIRVNIGLLFSRTALIPVRFVETDHERKTLVLKR